MDWKRKETFWGVDFEEMCKIEMVEGFAFWLLFSIKFREFIFFSLVCRFIFIFHNDKLKRFPKIEK